MHYHLFFGQVVFKDFDLRLILHPHKEQNLPFLCLQELHINNLFLDIILLFLLGK
jgi:hypothetical protein